MIPLILIVLIDIYLFLNLQSSLLMLILNN